jgi:hypothetical protein
MDSVYKGGSEIEMRMVAVARVVAVLVAALAGCSAQKPDYLYVDMHSRPVRLQLLKSFGRFEQRYEPVSINECAVYEAPARSDGERQPFPAEVWRVVSIAPDVPVLEVRYGAVPRGFLQSYPAGNPPAPLLPGHHYVAECTGDTQGSNEFAIPEENPPPH